MGNWVILRGGGGVDGLFEELGRFEVFLEGGTLEDLAFLRGLGSCIFFERPSII